MARWTLLAPVVALWTPCFVAAQGEEIVVEGRLSFELCFPFGGFLCRLVGDPGYESYPLVGDDSTAFLCARMPNARVRVRGILREFTCDPVEVPPGPGLVPIEVTELPATTLCGDANADGAVDLSDAIRILEHLFQGARRPAVPTLADVNGDGSLDLSDAVYLLDFLFKGGTGPACHREGA